MGIVALLIALTLRPRALPYQALPQLLHRLTVRIRHMTLLDQVDKPRMFSYTFPCVDR